jgi:DNA replication protein DnaC
LGKTFLSSCIAKQLLSEGRNVFFGSILKLFRQIEEERFRRRDGDTTSIIIGSELVILDDLGSEFQTTFTDSVLYEIINERVNLGRPTIISTNLSMKELDKKYNERIVSRLTGCFSPIYFIGNDVRQEKRKMGL